MSNLKETAENALEMGKQVKESVVAFGETAATKAADVRDGAGQALHNAAWSVRKGSAAIDTAANKLDSAGSYLESCSVKSAANRVSQFGRNHMTGSLIAAVAVGFLAGSYLVRAMQTRPLPAQ